VLTSVSLLVLLLLRDYANRPVFYYGSTFFKTVGIENAFLVSMITTAVNVGSTPISFWTIEKFGRRALLIYGAIGMLICEFIIAIVGTVDEGSDAAGICLIAFTCLYIFFFASTWGPGAWVVIGEIYPLPIRAKGVALSTASNVSTSLPVTLGSRPRLMWIVVLELCNRLHHTLHGRPGVR